MTSALLGGLTAVMYHARTPEPAALHGTGSWFIKPTKAGLFGHPVEGSGTSHAVEHIQHHHS